MAEKKDKRIGNKFWEARSSHGRKPIFSDPEKILSASLEYFKWCEENPLYESKAFAYQGEVTLKEVPRMRAMTVSGLCLFLDISFDTWQNYKKKKDFLDIIGNIENFIRNQKFEGAAADLLNANIIARDLGLADKKEITGANGGPTKIILVAGENDDDSNS